MPASYSSHSGMASMNWDTTSGGVKIAPTTNAPTKTYRRTSLSFATVMKPILTITTTATGTWKVMPNATNMVNTKLRYLSMSVITATPWGADAVIKPNTTGNTAK